MLNQYPPIKLSIQNEYAKIFRIFKEIIQTGRTGGISLHVIAFLNIIYKNIHKKDIHSLRESYYISGIAVLILH